MQDARAAKALRRDVDAVDMLGVVLLLATAGWVIVLRLTAASAARAPLALLLAVAVAVAAARLIEQQMPGVVAAAVVVWVAVVVLHHYDEALGGPVTNPLGYANANATFYVLAAAAAAQMAWRPPNPALRRPGVVAAAVFVVLAVANQSTAGTVLGLLVPLALLARRGPRVVGALLVAGTVAGLLALAGTTALGLSHGADAVQDDRANAILDLTLTERRLELWHDALVLIAEHPVTGVGHGQFVEHSRTTPADADEEWAHQEYLHVGAELGLPGLVLVLGLVGWGFLRLARSPRDGAVAAAAIALTAVALHATVDYVWHFWQIPVATALLVGAAAAPDRQAGTMPPRQPSRQGRG